MKVESVFFNGQYFNDYKVTDITTIPARRGHAMLVRVTLIYWSVFMDARHPTV